MKSKTTYNHLAGPRVPMRLFFSYVMDWIVIMYVSLFAHLEGYMLMIPSTVVLRPSAPDSGNTLPHTDRSRLSILTFLSHTLSTRRCLRAHSSPSHWSFPPFLPPSLPSPPLPTPQCTQHRPEASIGVSNAGNGMSHGWVSPSP